MKTKVLLMFVCLLLAGCVKATPEAVVTAVPTTPYLPNPASAFCEQQGYTSEIRTAADGSQSGVCVFSAESECDEWAFYRGECSPPTGGGSLPNPASVYCGEQGYTSEIRTAQDGSQSGVCIFSDGSECDEWAFYRGECKPSSSVNPTEPSGSTTSEWATYTNDTLGYSFQYPAGAQITTNDNPLKGLYIAGEGMGTETWGIAHPTDRVEFRPPEGTDLLQWLEDHYLMGEERLADTTIAGITAIHFRHPASPQSYAVDTYYFARSGQLYQIMIGHSAVAEDWALDNRFLDSFKFFELPADQGEATPIPTALPVDPLAYQDWITYTNQAYGFTLRIPDGWVIEETDSSDPLLGGHEVKILNIVDQAGQFIRLTFKRVGEDTLLWPTGVGQGEFVPQGTLLIGGKPAQRVLLVCPGGEVTAIWYHQSDTVPSISRGDLEFGIIFSMPGHCEAVLSLSGELQLIGETIIASLSVP